MRRTLIIAEAGVNHDGSVEKAKALIDVAYAAKVDYVKFQTFKAEKLVGKSAQMADYQLQNTGKDETQFQMLKKLELSIQDHHELIDYCRQKGIQFLSTAFDLESLDVLNDLGIEIFKIPSGEITNLPYLEKVASLKKPIILSTGMSDMNDISKALDVLRKYERSIPQITVLHCNTEYPTPFEDVNMNAMLSIAKEFNVSIGYSDHTLGIEVPIAAVALGATVIEKHFTLSRNDAGPDHRASLEPEELMQMVQSIRNIELAMGSFEKMPSASEQKNIHVARKSIHVAKELIAGKVLEKEDLVMMRPGNGISPMELPDILGKKTKKMLKPGELLKREDLK